MAARARVIIATLSGAAMVLVGVTLGLVLTTDAQATDYDCADFSSQAAAESFFLGHGGPASDPYNLDADGDGVACESNPCPCSTGGGSPSGGGGGGGGASKPHRAHCRRPGHAVRVTFSKSEYPNIISHIKYSWRIGYPKRLVIWRKQADQRRDQVLRGIPTKSGYDRDEAPAAVLRKKVSADVRYVPSSENRSAGASLGNQISPYCNGVHVRYRFTR